MTIVHSSIRCLLYLIWNNIGKTSSLFSSSLLFCNLLSFLLCDTSLTSHYSFSSLVGGPLPLLQGRSHHNHQKGVPHTLIPLPHPHHPPSLSHGFCCPGLSLVQTPKSLTPLTLNFLPGDDVHISMYNMVLVLWCMCMCACCSPVIQVCLADPLPSINPWNLPPSPNQPLPPHLLLLHDNTFSGRTAQLIPNAAWHISCFYCMGVCVSVCVRGCVRVCILGVGLICLYVGWVLIDDLVLY